MEDVLDEWNIKILHPKELDQQGAQVQSPTFLEKVHSFILSLCSCLKQVPILNEIAIKVKEINGKLESILREANEFNFLSTLSNSQILPPDFKRPITTSIFDESEVYGRDSDRHFLIMQMLPEVKENRVKVISIVGCGGSGKTTLAQILYNDDRVNKYFEVANWVCVSDPFDEKRIANALLEGTGMSGSNLSELESLLQLIKSFFSGKRFLLVLDDLWTEDYSKWKPFRDSLKDGAPGSVILVTTRKESVARVVGTDYRHALDLLSDTHCWFIIKQIALSKRSELCWKVEKIGLKIAEKCKGLPLAARTMGSLLQFKDTLQEWQDVLDSEIWQMKEASLELFPHFYLSYKELSPQLKRCFSYCAVFPKDSHMKVDSIIKLWMSQGYLGNASQKGDDSMEKKGRDHFKTLAMRSFFQEAKRDWHKDGVFSIKMHDIIHDFAQFIAKNECRVLDIADCQKVENKVGFTKERFRHVTLLGMEKPTISSMVLDFGKVRSLFLPPNSNVPQDLCTSLKSVRSLTLSECGLQELPQEIGNLIHLRFLNVSSNWFRILPETVCDLYYLETLDIGWCQKLEHLPERIGDLTHLRHLDNDGTFALQQMPPGIEKLASLRSLSRFIVDGGSSNTVGKLRQLNQLEELQIYVHCSAVNFEQAQLGDKVFLHKLTLTFERIGSDDSKSKRSLVEMIKVKPPPNLRVLQLYGYPTAQLPDWIEAKSLVNNLRNLVLVNADLVSSLPSLWMFSSLESLVLVNLSSIKHIGRAFFGLVDEGTAGFVAFPSLKTLILRYLSNWEKWEDMSEEDDENVENDCISVLPRLQSLQIYGCDKLKALPHRILRRAPSLKILKIHRSEILQKQYSKYSGKDWMKISHIPDVIFV
ncbi:OLC1v1000061C2 [Oldenlandia corymbosa var. corymbosa]|nr:OLC1v1000061C2 [Oldenlandia corymbosa var. corymbosa]